MLWAVGKNVTLQNGTTEFLPCHSEALKGMQGHYTWVASCFMHVVSGISHYLRPVFFISLHLGLLCVAWLILRRILQLQEKFHLCTTSMSSL